MKTNKSHLKAKKKALKYLRDSRKNLQLSKGELHSQFAIRVSQQQKRRTLMSMKSGTCLSHFIYDQNERSRSSGSMGAMSGEERVRSSSADLNTIQRKMYNILAEKNLKKERTSLSHSRYNKMKTLILKEVKNAIQEADHEPSASILDFNMIESIIQQNKEDYLNVGHDLPEVGSIASEHRLVSNSMIIKNNFKEIDR